MVRIPNTYYCIGNLLACDVRVIGAASGNKAAGRLSYIGKNNLTGANLAIVKKLSHSEDMKKAPNTRCSTWNPATTYSPRPW